MAATPPSAGEMEGVEASGDAAEELTCARRYAAGSSRMGGLFRRLLAYGRFADTRSSPAQRSLAATRPARVRSELAPSAPGLTNRRMRARMSGGVGGGPGNPTPYPIWVARR